MKKFFLKFFIVTTVLCALSGLSNATAIAETNDAAKRIKAEGTARALEGISDIEVKSFAVEDALKKSVVNIYESIASTDLDAPGMEAQKKTVTESALSYILDYRVLSEGWITHMEIEPGILPPLPLIEEEESEEGDIDDEPSAELSHATDIDAPRDIGGEGEAISKLGREAAPEIEVSVRLYHVWIEASVDVIRLRKDALTLNAALSDQGLETNSVAVLLLGVTDYDDFQSIRSILTRMDIVKSVKLESFLRKRIVLRAEVWGNPHMLLEKLASAEDMKGFDLVPAGPKSVIIRGRSK